jgi:hypothetical protein
MVEDLTLIQDFTELVLSVSVSLQLFKMEGPTESTSCLGLWNTLPSTIPPRLCDVLDIYSHLHHGSRSLQALTNGSGSTTSQSR